MPPVTRRRSAAAADLTPPATAAAASAPAASPRKQRPAGSNATTAAAAKADPAAAAGIDESAPLVFAVGKMGPAYWDWVDRPVAGKPRFFGPDWAEACSKTVWWVVPLIWIPVAAAAAVASLRGLAAAETHAPLAAAASAAARLRSLRGGRAAAAWLDAAAATAAAGRGPSPLAAAALQLVALQAAGLVLWQLLEYVIHRFAFHAKGDSYWAITIHFLFHGNHHKYPMDGERLVFPPLPACAIASLIYAAIRAALPRPAALGLMSGVLFGYVAYDCIHYSLHHGGKGLVGAVMRGAYFRDLRLRHHHHHYQDDACGYQISSPLFDVVFRTRSDLGRR